MAHRQLIDTKLLISLHAITGCVSIPITCIGLQIRRMFRIKYSYGMRGSHDERHRN